MKHITGFRIEVSQVTDRYVAEIVDGDGGCVDALLSPAIRESAAMTVEASRHFALKTFCAEIGDTLQAHLEQI